MRCVYRSIAFMRKQVIVVLLNNDRLEKGGKKHEKIQKISCNFYGCLPECFHACSLWR